MQEALLANMPDTDSPEYKSYSYERILKREIDFYRDTGEPKNVDAILQANLQIETSALQWSTTSSPPENTPKQNR